MITLFGRPTKFAEPNLFGVDFAHVDECQSVDLSESRPWRGLTAVRGGKAVGLEDSEDCLPGFFGRSQGRQSGACS